MENELEGSTVPPSSKQAFIYKKNPSSTAKAITRKLRPSHAPNEIPNSTGGESAYRTAGGKSRFEGARSSHNEAETIATQGQRSGVSPSSKAFSQGHFPNVDSSGAIASGGPYGNKRFQRGSVGSTGKKGSYYEDNIDSETEVFIDPRILDNKSSQKSRLTEMNRKRKPAGRELFPSGDEQPNNYLLNSDNRKANHRRSQPSAPLSQADHFKAIDAVMNSNADDRTKQRLIADIQEKYRLSQLQRRGAEHLGAKAGKPKNQKQFLKEDNPHDEQFQSQQIRRRLRPTTDQLEHQNSFERRATEQQLPQKGLTAKPTRQHRGGNRQPDEQRDHQNYLMPEMNEFMDANKRNYLTQDEMGDNRPVLNRRNKKKNQRAAESEDNDELVDGKIKHFTPGRIRASRMGTNTGIPDGTNELFNSTNGRAKNGGKKIRKGPHVESVDREDGAQSLEDAMDYNQLLPAVKVRPKKKHRSPSDHSPGENSSINAGIQGRNLSMSKISNAGKDPKLRATLDQNLHWKPTSVKVPVKQTNFYDDKHGSGITDQQLQTWKVRNGSVMLDDFHTGKKKVPVNRHRIPAVGDENVFVGGKELKRGQRHPAVSPDSFLWDMDGRRHKKPKQPKAPRAITQNASHRKVDLPRINSNQPNLLSPKNRTNSQPSNLGKHPKGPPPGKFIGINDKRIKNIIPPTTNQDSHLDLIDIDIKPNPNDLPDYDCPVCLIRVRGQDTAPHSRNCRTQACRFCHVEQPLIDLDKHELICNKDQGPIRCRFCRSFFPADQILDHETHICKEPGRCRFCKRVYPNRELKLHEETCNEMQMCKGCLNGFPPQDINRHEAVCKWPARCRFCRNQFPIKDIDRHEAKCDQPSKCRGCKNELPRREYFDNHVNQCKQPSPCDFCGNHYLPKDIDRHEENCNHPISCANCLQKFPRLEIPSHESQCPGLQPEVDPKPYLEHVERQRQRLQKRTKGAVIVEDDYIKPEDFRDPGGRKKREPSNESNQGKPPLKSRGSSRPSRSLGRKSSKSPNHPDNLSQNRSVDKQKSIEHRESLTTSIQIQASPINRRSTADGKILDSEKTPKGILKDNNSTTPNRQNSSDPANLVDGTNQNSRNATGTLHSRDINSQEPNTRPKINESHSRTNGFRSQDRIRTNQTQNIDQRVISIGSRERVPPQTEHAKAYDHDLNDSIEKGSGPTQNGRYDQDYEQKPGKHVHSTNDVTSNKIVPSRGKHQSSEYVGSKTKLTKIQSQTATSQVRFAYGTTSENLLEKQIQESATKVMTSQVVTSVTKVQKEEKSRHERQAYASMEARHEQQSAQVQMRKQKSSPGSKKRPVTKSQTGDLSVSKKSSKMYFPDDKSGGRSNNSKSPEARRVMGMLTHHRVKIDKTTKLLINGSEILTHEGIKGNINKVGIGFGTGRWTSGRRLDLLKEVPVAVNRQSKNKMTSLESPQHRHPVRMDAETQHAEPDVHSEGCDPITNSVRSEKISAHVSGRDLGLSARTQTQVPERESIGVSAKPISEISVREQGDQITEGRFEPAMIDTQVNTDKNLLEEYLKKPKNDSGVNTAPVIFGKEKPKTYSALIQTEPLVNEYAVMDEPLLNSMAHEPETAKVNPETGSQSSLLDVPACDEILTLVLPEPEEEDEYVDDWADSQLYKYAFELHYDHMVKKRLISETIVERPVPSPRTAGMNKAQKFEHNLNPDGLAILSYMECDYGQAALRHKSATYKNEKTLQDLYDRAKTTISVLNANMVRPDICDRVLFHHYSEVTSKNVIKLLLRVKRLYDARNESVNILKLVMEVEAVITPKSDLWCIMGDNSRSALRKPFLELLQRTLKILSNALTRITIFQQEHHLFKDEFKFNKKEYRDYIRDIGRIIGGFLRMKNQPNPALQETGLLLEEHEEHLEQASRYESWVKQSLQDYGRLEVPDENMIEQTLQMEESSKKKLKGSRIDKALSKLREEQKERSERDSSAYELTSKSKILHQMQIKQVQLEIDQQQSSAVVNEQWQKTSVSDQMLDRLQESANKREAKARKLEEERLRQERRDRGEPSDGYCEENDFENEPLKLSDLRPSQKSEADLSAYEQINIGRFNFAISEKDNKKEPSIQITDQNEQRSTVAIPQLTGLSNSNKQLQIVRIKSSQQAESVMSLDRDSRVSPTNETQNIDLNSRNPDYIDQYQHSSVNNNNNMLNSQSISSPSVKTMVPKATTSNLPMTFGRPVQRTQDSAYNIARTSEDEDDQTEYTVQMENESERIPHEMLDQSTDQVHLGGGRSNASDDDGQTINSGRRSQANIDANSNFRIINQGSIKIKYQSSQASANEV